MVTPGIQSILRGNIMDAIGRGAEYAGSWDPGSQALFLLPGTFCEKMNGAWKGYPLLKQKKPL